MHTGSNPVATSLTAAGESFETGRRRAIGAAVARFPDTEEVTGSIPVSPTTKHPYPERVNIDWAAVAGIATAAGTLALAVATFASTRTANRAAQSAEQLRLEALRPILIPSAWGDPVQKISFIDGVWLHVAGGRAAMELSDDAVYLVLSVRNAGRGLAVLHGWSVPAERDSPHADPETVHRLTRDIYIASDYTGFAQIAARDPATEEFRRLKAAASAIDTFWVDVLYSDMEGAQRVITRFGLSRGPAESASEEWYLAAARHWNVDLPDPR